MNAAFSFNPLADRFAWLFEGLCKAIGVEAHRHGMEAALAWMVWNRVRELGERFMRVAERARDGRFARRDTSPRPSPQSGDKGEAREAVTVAAAPEPTEKIPAASSRPAQGLPREFGWVTRALPQTMRFAGVLTSLLRDPETAELVETAPEAGRILRPLCHLLGVETPAFLRRGRAKLAGPPPHLPSPPPEAEANDSGGDAAMAATPEAPAAVETPAPAPPPQYADWRLDPKRPGGLYWDPVAKRLAWS